jgi:hypothetical protein
MGNPLNRNKIRMIKTCYSEHRIVYMACQEARKSMTRRNVNNILLSLVTNTQINDLMSPKRT